MNEHSRPPILASLFSAKEEAKAAEAPVATARYVRADVDKPGRQVIHKGEAIPRDQIASWLHQIDEYHRRVPAKEPANDVG